MKKLVFSFLLLFSSTLVIAQLTVTANSLAICSGSCGTITATVTGGTPGYVYFWNTGATTASINPCPTTTTSYTVIVTDVSATTASALATITVNPVPVITCPSASICEGSSTTLTASGATSYTWTSGGGLNTTVGCCVTANPASTSTYTVVGTQFGCTGSTSVVVTVQANLVPIISGTTIVCGGSSTMLTATGGGTYSWDTGATTPSITVTPTITTTYTVTVTTNTCTGSASVQVKVDPSITLNVAAVDATTCSVPCDGQTIVVPSGGSGSYTYSWSHGCLSAACSNICAGTYTIVTTDGIGCTKTADVTVNCPSGIKEQTNTNVIVKIYPNPFTDNTTFTILSDKQNGKYSFELVDVLGKLVKSMNDISTKQFQISRTGLTNGIYFYKIYDSEKLIGVGKAVIK